ncbi:MAG: hypothetical protein V3V12_08990 [Gammaproteobacteria bacterium]
MSEANTSQQALTVVVNGEPVIEYDRAKSLTEHQLEYLERMDQKMSLGIELSGKWLQSPDEMQQAQFVAMQLIPALLQNNDGLAAALCAWVAVRMPQLQQLRAEVRESSCEIDFVTDREHSEEHRVELIIPEDFRKKQD